MTWGACPPNNPPLRGIFEHSGPALGVSMLFFRAACQSCVEALCTVRSDTQHGMRAMTALVAAAMVVAGCAWVWQLPRAPGKEAAVDALAWQLDARTARTEAAVGRMLSAFQADIARQLHEHFVQSEAAMGGFRADTTRHLAALNRSLGLINWQLQQHGHEAAALSRTVGSIEARLERQEPVWAAMNRSVSGFAARLERHESVWAALNRSIGRIEARLARQEHVWAAMNRTFEARNDALNAKLDAIDRRLECIEGLTYPAPIAGDVLYQLYEQYGTGSA